MEVDGVNLAIGGGAVSAIAGVVGALIKARLGKTKLEPTPLPVTTEKAPKYVTVQEFNRHVEQNAAEHRAMVDDRERNYEALYNRQLANDKLTSEIKGKLDGIKDDLSLIKQKLFRSK